MSTTTFSNALLILTVSFHQNLNHLRFFFFLLFFLKNLACHNPNFDPFILIIIIILFTENDKKKIMMKNK